MFQENDGNAEEKNRGGAVKCVVPRSESRAGGSRHGVTGEEIERLPVERGPVSTRSRKTGCVSHLRHSCSLKLSLSQRH